MAELKIVSARINSITTNKVFEKLKIRSLFGKKEIETKLVTGLWPSSTKKQNFSLCIRKPKVCISKRDHLNIKTLSWCLFLEQNIIANSQKALWLRISEVQYSKHFFKGPCSEYYLLLSPVFASHYTLTWKQTLILHCEFVLTLSILTPLKCCIEVIYACYIVQKGKGCSTWEKT